MTHVYLARFRIHHGRLAHEDTAAVNTFFSFNTLYLSRRTLITLNNINISDLPPIYRKKRTPDIYTKFTLTSLSDLVFDELRPLWGCRIILAANVKRNVLYCQVSQKNSNFYSIIEIVCRSWCQTSVHEKILIWFILFTNLHCIVTLWWLKRVVQ